MRPDETLDEAIDRVASHMTRSDPNVELAPMWVTPAPRGWTMWRMAGGAGLAVALLGVALTLVQRGNRDVDAPVDSSPLVAWSSLHAPVSEVFGTPEVPGTPEGVPYVPTRAPMAAKPQLRRAVDEERSTWGISFIEEPAALALSALTTSTIELAQVGVGAIEVPPLSFDSKEQR